MNDLTWFYDFVESRLGKTLSDYNFKRLIGKAYEEENIDEWATLFYESDAGTRMFIDMQLRHQGPDRTPFYVVRMRIGKHNLKVWLYPDLGDPGKDTDLSQPWLPGEGWGGFNQAEVKDQFEEIAVALERYLASNSQNI